MKCKWVVDLSQEHENITKSKSSAYYLQTTCGAIEDENIKEISLDVADGQGERVGSYEYLISSLRKILIES